MKIPKTFYLRGRMWNVKEVENLHHEDGDKVRGQCATDERVIELEKNLKQQIKYGVFIHELFHALIHESAIPENASFTEDIEEVLVESLTDMFTHDLKVTVNE